MLDNWRLEMNPIREIVFFTLATVIAAACTGSDPILGSTLDQQEAGSDGSKSDVGNDAGSDAGAADTDADVQDSDGSKSDAGDDASSDAGDADTDTILQYDVTTLAGTGDDGSNDGPGETATFNKPWGMAIGPDGSLYIADNWNHKIRKIATDGKVSTYAGTGSVGYADNACSSATFFCPEGIAVDKDGNVYVADAANSVIRKITSTLTTCQVSTLAGSGFAGSADGVGTEASFNFPRGLTVDTSGNVYVADRSNNKIRKVTRAGVVITIAGTGPAGNTNGAALTTATFDEPAGIAVDETLGVLYVNEGGNNADVRKITFDGMGNPLTVSTLAGLGVSPAIDGIGLNAIDANGNLYVADGYNNAIRIISPAGDVKTLAGTGKAGADNGPADQATFNGPLGVTSNAGIVYVADGYNNKIRKIAPAP